MKFPCKRYALFHKKEKRFLTFFFSANEGVVHGNATSCELDLACDDDPLWLASSYEDAQRALTSTPWYNSGYGAPINEYAREDLEIVEIELNSPTHGRIT